MASMPFLSIGTLYEVGLQYIGLRILSEHLRTAALIMAQAATPHYAARSHRLEEIHESICFVQGSGLETTIRTYALPFDAEELRGTFYAWADRMRRRSQWGSVTTREHGSLGAALQV